MTTIERANYIYKVCRAAGVTYAGAIGMLGNLQGETSDFDPMSCETQYLNRYGLTDAEYTRRADAGEKIHGDYYFTHDAAGYGIVQWTYWSRKKGLLDFSKAVGKSVGDLDVQIAYMLKELSGYYTAAWQVLTATDSIYEAVKICVTAYEKPANQADAISRRTAYANAWAKLIPDGDAAEPSEPAQDDKPAGESYDRRKVIALALAEVGYLEKKSADQLDNQTANAGSANYTKYARDLDALGDFYNGSKQGYAWCDVFVDWLLVQCFGEAAALKLLCAKRGSSGAGCTYSLNYYIAAGRYLKRADKPEVGDQIFFGSVGNSNHTGLVYKVDDTTVYTVEGNTSSADGVVPNGGAVCRKSYPRSYSGIAGYGRPAYNDGFVGDSVDAEPVAPTPEPSPEPETPAETKPVFDPPELKTGDKGAAVKKLQHMLLDCGCSVGPDGADGDFGSRTASAVRLVQKRLGRPMTGTADAWIWAALIGR